jgi:LemA protein
MMVAIIIAVPIIFLVMMYNGLVGKKNQVENAFGGMDTMLKKRYDLIPNLIASVQKYMEHEKSTLTDLTAMRAQAMAGGMSDDDRVALDNKISKSLAGINIAVENYPDLKADQSFTQLQRSLNEVEEQISASRRSYNASVTDYNNAVEMFPTNFMATQMNYKRKEVFEIPEGERENVDVGKLFDK